MPTDGVRYPRALVRTWKGSVTHLAAIYGVILAGLVLRASRPGLPGINFLVLAGLTLVPLALAGRALTLLRALERLHPEPDAAMVFLFDLSISLPIMCLAFVSNFLWLLN